MHRINKNILNILILVIGLSSCVNRRKSKAEADFKASPIPERLDQVLESYFEHERFSGSVLLARDGELLLNKGYGLANWEEGQPKIQADTPFNIGSIGKIFTQVLVLRNVESGRWHLDDTISTLWPQSGLPNADKITLRHLLSHQSGLGNYFAHPDYSLAQRSLEDMLGLIRTQELAFEEPGESSFYSNSAFWVLAALSERYDENGRTWSEIYQQDIFDAAGMDGVKFYQPDEPAKDRPRGYYFSPIGERSDRTHEDPRPGPDGGLYMSAEDLWKFHQALANETWYSRSTFNASIDKTYGPMALPGCALGLVWEICDLEGIRLITKGGTTEGGGSEYVQFKHNGHNYVLILLSNFSNVPLMIYQDVLQYMLGYPGGSLAGETPSVVVHRALESGKLELLRKDFPAWSSEQKLMLSPFDLYLLAQYYVNADLPERAKAVLEMDLAAFPDHHYSAAFLDRLSQN